jgi:YgiT-type zinc finger domain-containing protein
MQRSLGTQDMECIYCKGTLMRKRVPYTVVRRGYQLIISDVPAWVCSQCGESMFDEETVEAVQSILSEVDSRVETLVAVSV